jgi:hypothetical protein
MKERNIMKSIFKRKQHADGSRHRFNPTNYHMKNTQDRPSTKAGGETEQKIVGNVCI